MQSGDNVWATPANAGKASQFLVVHQELNKRPGKKANRSSSGIRVTPAPPPKNPNASSLNIAVNDSQVNQLAAFADERGTTIEQAAVYLMNRGLELLAFANTYK